MKALMYAGIGLCGVGAVALVIGAIIDVDAADPWASVGGGAAGLIGIGLALYAHFSLTPSRSPSVSATGERSIAAGGNIGIATTGDGAAPAVPPAMPTATPAAPGGATAAGGRSIAAGGDIGTASTGDV
ncbi:hypothetical protein [Streptomyces coelicoflavus]|uniref:hypothetical protein n=1 Tax=Streptomyces coelicoflavus TaxID=285562 RepID=UPI001FD53444|nr:hypothetical protein [Streptomyces coelicoflavus]